MDGGVAGRVARVVAGDFIAGWIVTGSTPTIGAYLRGVRTAPPRYDRAWLHRVHLLWAYTFGTAGTLAGHSLAHITQSPLRTAVATAVLVGLFILT